VDTFAFSPDGQTLATGSRDKTARLWEVQSGQLKGTLQGHPGPVGILAFSPDGRLLATWDFEEVRLWDAVSGQLKGTLQAHRGGWQRPLVFSADGKTLVTGSKGHQGLYAAQLWDLANGQIKASLPGVSKLAISPEGKALAIGSEDMVVRLLDAGSGVVQATLHAGRGVADGLAFSPDGTLLATAEHGQEEVRLWDIVAGHVRATLQGPSGWNEKVLAFSPDGQTLAIGGLDPTNALAASLWEAATGQRTVTVKGDQPGFGDPRDVGWVTVFAFSPDGKRLATGSADHAEKVGVFCTAHLWDVASGQRESTFDGVSHLAFCPDGKTLATVRGTIGAWSASKDEIAELKTVRLWSVTKSEP
jgi:WD40 repeat protein